MAMLPLRAPHSYGPPSVVASGAVRAAALLLLLLHAFARGYVFLDTSDPRPDTGSAAGTAARPRDSQPPPDGGSLSAPDTASATGAAPDTVPVPGAGPRSATAPAAPGARRGPPRFGTVLFLSADSKLIYAYIGVFKALQQYGLAPDAVLAESKAAAVGAAWALGYDARAMESWFLAHPLESLLNPRSGKPSVEERAYRPDGRDAPQWDVPLSLDAFQSRNLKWSDVAGADPGEYLRLSWAMARLTHDAPYGPVENLEAAPRRLAIQVSDLESARGAVLAEGNLQAILKGALLPDEVIRRRPRYWPYASGALLSGHAVMADRLPFTCERMILIEPGRRLRPPALQPRPLPWTDSLELRAKALAVARDAEAFPSGLQAQALRITLDPGSGFDPAETDPLAWIDLGYTSALRSMDVLRQALAPDRIGPPAADTGAERLGLNHLSVNPLAPGGHQLLLDILRESEGEAPDSTGEGALASLSASGYYDDLDVEWARGSEKERALLVFDAREKSALRFRAGWNALVAGGDLRDRPPEIFGGLFWNEPFYIPLEAGIGATLGGNRPGFGWEFAIAPIYPWRMKLGLGFDYEQADLPPPFQSSPTLGMGSLSFPVGYRRRVLRGFLEFVPTSRFSSRSEVRSDSVVVTHRRDDFDYPGAGDPDSLKSVDFLENLYLGLGKANSAGVHPLAWKGRFRYLNPVVTSGFPRTAFSSAESEITLSLGAFRLIDQYYWSDQDPAEMSEGDLYLSSGAYQLLQAGRIEAFSFQSEYFLRFLHSAHFRDVRAEFAPVWRRGGLKATVGAWGNIGKTFFPEQGKEHPFLGTKIPGRGHWELQAGYATPLGTVRVGMGGLFGDSPLYYVRIGSDSFRRAAD